MDSTRRFVKDVKRVIIKVGTVVATRSNGRLAVGTIACLCEQVEELNSRGYELILVNGSFEDLQKPELESDGKAQAVVGQNELIGLYDTLFTQLDLASSNLLVTEKDFDDPSFRRQLSETVNSLLARKVIPILNENDALSTRRAPYEDSWGILRDNDNLVGLLAMELKADLLILLGDEEGLYGGPPTDPRSKIIHTYIAKIHESQVARGDMAAKVNAVVCVASAGTPVVISSAFASAGILKVLEGEKIGTLFHRDAEKLVAMKKSGAREMTVSARECSRRFQNLTLEEWKKVMLNVANALEENEKLIMAENEADVKVAKLHGYGKTFLSRLTLKPGEISRSAKYIRDMKTPIESLIKYTKISDGLVLKETTSPSGVLLAVFESCPGDLVLV